MIQPAPHCSARAWTKPRQLTHTGFAPSGASAASAEALKSDGSDHQALGHIQHLGTAHSRDRLNLSWLQRLPKRWAAQTGGLPRPLCGFRAQQTLGICQRPAWLDQPHRFQALALLSPYPTRSEHPTLEDLAPLPQSHQLPFLRPWDETPVLSIHSPPGHHTSPSTGRQQWAGADWAGRCVWWVSVLNVSAT